MYSDSDSDAVPSQPPRGAPRVFPLNQSHTGDPSSSKARRPSAVPFSSGDQSMNQVPGSSYTRFGVDTGNPAGDAQRKRIRSSLDSSTAAHRKRTPAVGGSPLNPSSSRAPSAQTLLISTAQAKRRAAGPDNAFESNPMYEDGMDIFQDPLNPSSALDAKVLALRRRAQELGPAPLPPTRPLQISTSPPPPLAPYSRSPIPGRQSLDIASPRSPSSPTPTRNPHATSPPVSPLQSRSLSPQPFAIPGIDENVIRATSPNQKAPSPVPDTIFNSSGRDRIKHLLGDRKGKGKDKSKQEVPLIDDSVRDKELEERIAAIRESPLAKDPTTLQRVRTVADQLERRYRVIYTALESGTDPPDPLQVVRWQRRRLDADRSINGGLPTRHDNLATIPPFDLRITTDTGSNPVQPITPLYTPEDIKSLSWVRGLNSVHRATDPRTPRKEMKDWHLTAGVVEAFKQDQERRTVLQESGLFHDSPISSQPSFSGPLGVGNKLQVTPPRSSISSDRPPDVPRRETLSMPTTVGHELLTISSNSQASDFNSRTAQDRMRVASAPVAATPYSTPTSPNFKAKSKPPTTGPKETGGAASTRSSLDIGFTSDDPPRSKRRSIRNSLPGFLDSSKHSLAQFLNPSSNTVPSANSAQQRSASSSIPRIAVPTPTSPRSQTAPRPSTERSLPNQLSQEKPRLTIRDPQSDDGASSQSDHVPRSPIQSTSDEGGKVYGRRTRPLRTAPVPSLTELIRSEKLQDPTRRKDLPRARVTSGEGHEMSTSDEDFSLRRGIGNAGRKMAQSLGAIAERVGKGGSGFITPNGSVSVSASGVYEDRASAQEDAGLGEPMKRQPMFRFDTGATVRPGTRSDHMLQTGRRRAAMMQNRKPQLTKEEEESKLAKKTQREQRERTAYEQRLSLVMESRRQSAAVDYMLQISVRAISDYVRHQAALSSSLGLALEPSVPSDIFDVLGPMPPSDELGWKAVEDDHNARERRNVLMHRQLRNLRAGRSVSSITSEDSLLDRVVALAPVVLDQLESIELDEESLAISTEQLLRLQIDLLKAMDEADALSKVASEKIDSAYPELAINEDLWQRVRIQTAQVLLPEWVPWWARDVIFLADPIVKFTTDFIIQFAWLLDLLPATPRRIAYFLWLGGIKGVFYLGLLSYDACYAAGRRLREISDTWISAHGSYTAAFALCIASAIALGSFFPSTTAPSDSALTFSPTNSS